MEEFLDHYLCLPSWADEDLNERSWAHSDFNPLLPISTGVCQIDEKDLPLSMISSSSTQNLEVLAAQDTSSLVSGGVCGEQMGSENFNSNSMNGFSKRLVFGNLDLQHNEAVGDLATSVSFAETGCFEITDAGTCQFGRPLGELETLSPVTAFWSVPSFESMSDLSPLMGGNERQSSYLQEGIADNAGNVTRYVEIDKILQPEKLLKGEQDIQNCTMVPFAAGPQTTNETIVLPSLPQMVSTTPKGGSNGVGKPRVRARRGQATDPHSIAERLRRERISERMKNLQELVPNSNKTDKASMLDEIIEYVKFLQLEVKVLSMSRFGAAGAVVPLLTDGQAEVSNGSSFSPFAGRGLPEFSPSPEQIALEQEVVKLMESNVTSAMQYLQTKGLCLIPIALAAAISSGKVSSTGSNSKEMKKCCYTSGLCDNTGGSSSSDSNSNGSLAGIGIDDKLSKDGPFCDSYDNVKPAENSLHSNGPNSETATQV